MKEYRRGSHSVFELHVHLVLSTKYQKRVLKKDAGHRLRGNIARNMQWAESRNIVRCNSNSPFMLVAIPPQVSVSKLVQKLKGKSTYKLQREFTSLRKEY